jgi:hypothetical protein
MPKNSRTQNPTPRMRMRAALAEATEAVRGFSGELAKPIVVRPPLGLLGDMVVSQEVSRRRYAKLNLLLLHYDIGANKKDKWLKLTKRLALDVVPGMQVFVQARTRTGPKARRAWPPARYEKLVAGVDIIRNEFGPKSEITAAVHELVDRNPKEWGSFKGKERSLETRYYEGRRMIQRRDRPLSGMAKNLF